MSRTKDWLERELKSTQNVLVPLRERSVRLSKFYLDTTLHDFRSCGCELCDAARAVQGIRREVRQEKLRGIG